MLIIKTVEGYKQVVASDINIHEYAAQTKGIVMDDSEFFELPKSNEQLKEEVSARRYISETSGITLNNMFIDTSRDSLALITGAALSAMLDNTYVCNWKTAEGFVQLDAQTLIGIAQSIRAHVQACFDREAELLSALDSGTYSAAMLEEGWPV